MKLGELKKSLNRFPPDMNDSEILVQFVDGNGEVNVDCLAYVAAANFPSDTKPMVAILLGSWQAADEMQKKDPEKFPPNWRHRPEITPRNEETDENS